MCCNKLKNIIIFFMISCLLTSCSNHDKNNDKEKNMDYYDIKELSINYDNIHFLKCSLLGKDQVIFLSGDSIYSEATEQSLYSFCLNSGEMKNIKPEIEFRSNSYYTVAGTEDGRIFLITSSADKNNKEMEDDSSYDNEEFSYKLFEIDEYGSLISEKNIDIEINNDFISNFIVWNDYFVLFNNENQKSFLTVIDSNGDVIDSLIDEISGDIISVCISYNNQLSVMSVDGSDVVISLFDFNDLKKVNKFEYKNNDMINYTSIFGGNESNNLIINSELKLIGLNTDGEKSNIIEWNDSILSDVRTEMIISGENNDFTIFGTYCGESKIYKLTKLDETQIKSKKTITLGIFGSDADIIDKINEYNLSQNNINIKTIKYDIQSMQSDYDEIMDRFRKDIISDKAPDMIYTHDRNIIKMYAKQGVYMDLYQCFENDSDLKTEELLPNVLSACETDGKLYSISPEFTVNTMIANEKIVNIENWNVNDMIKINNSLPENMSFFENNRRDDILDIMIYLFSEEINLDNNTCNFNKKEIKDFMLFAEKLDVLNNSDNIDQDDNSIDSSIDIVLSELHIDNFRSYLIDTVSALGQREPCIVGYPTLNGNGGSLEFQRNLAILNNSQNKDLCWDFIKNFFENEEITNIDELSFFPTKISLFDKIAEESMHSSIFIDEDGKETIKPLIANYKGNFIEVEPLTENEKNKLVEYIKSINHEGMSIRKNIQDVLIDEIYPWLYGENSSEELLQNLQSRISILLSE